MDPTAGAGPDPRRGLEAADLARLARRGMRAVVRAARADDQPDIAGLLTGHVGEDPEIAVQEWATHDTVNAHLGLEAWFDADPRRRPDSYGLSADPVEVDLAGLAGGAEPYGAALRPVPVARTNLASGPDGATTAVPRHVLHLGTDGDARVAVVFRQAAPHFGRASTTVEVASDDPGRARAITREIARLALERNVYRGQVVSFSQEMFGPGGILTFHPRPEVGRDELVVDDELLATLERQVAGVARHRDALTRAGRHLSRGVLLYGPPGVGKTHTVRYLASVLTDVTFVLLGGRALGAIGLACSVARSLQPAVVVVEDVDLIAEDRGAHPGEHPLLFELLGEMDGLGSDADVAFVLTTNRADLLEPALAARPGRIDQAVELTLPDERARRRLLDLYGRGLELDVSPATIDDVVAATEGVTASFVKELWRRAALVALDARPGAGAVVRDDDLRAALAELLDGRNRMTRVLLGAAGGLPERSTPADAPPRPSPAAPGLAPAGAYTSRVEMTFDPVDVWGDAGFAQESDEDELGDEDE